MIRRIITVIILLALICLPSFVIWQNALKIQNIGQQILAEYQYLNDRYQQGQQIRRLKSLYTRYEPSESKLQALDINPGEEVNFVTSIEKMAADHHVSETLNMDFNAAQPRENLELIPLTLLLQGHYSDVVTSIETLSNLPVVVGITHIEFTPLESTQGQDVSVVIEGSVYRVPKNGVTAAAPAATTPAPASSDDQ